ncbi:MAG: hypothetical protein ACRDRH_15895 [Pseudonocardia sp.]
MTELIDASVASLPMLVVLILVTESIRQLVMLVGLLVALRGSRGEKRVEIFRAYARSNTSRFMRRDVGSTEQVTCARPGLEDGEVRYDPHQSVGAG